MKRRQALLRGFALALLPVTVAAGTSLALDITETPRDARSTDLQDAAALIAAARPNSLDRQWWGIEFARRFEEVPEIPVEVRSTAIHRNRELGIVGVLDRVNPSLRYLLGIGGGKVVLFGGRLTDVAENTHLRGTSFPFYEHRDFHWDHAGGLYERRTRTAFVKGDGSLFRSRHVLLHELGHMLDEKLSDISQGETFTEVTTLDDLRADLGYPERIANWRNKRQEYFADSFAFYHQSVETRRRLRRERPAVTEWFDDFVRVNIEYRYRKIERELESDLRERVERRAKARLERQRGF